jgi:ABC-type antimicrobial peptide transport system permease subunit
MILRQRMATTLLGVVIGLALAGALSQVVRSLLYEITPSDPATWLGVTAVIVGSSLLATYLPARRATKVDPSIVLNAE